MQVIPSAQTWWFGRTSGNPRTATERSDGLGWRISIYLSLNFPSSFLIARGAKIRTASFPSSWPGTMSSNHDRKGPWDCRACQPIITRQARKIVERKCQIITDQRPMSGRSINQPNVNRIRLGLRRAVISRLNESSGRQIKISNDAIQNWKAPSHNRPPI